MCFSIAPWVTTRLSAIAVFDLSAGAPEKEEGGLLGAPPGRRRAFDSLVKTIDEARHDKDTKAFYVRFGSASLGMARAEELVEGRRGRCRRGAGRHRGGGVTFGQDTPGPDLGPGPGRPPRQ